MMVAVFAAVLLALVAGAAQWRRAAVTGAVICLALSVWLFLFEVYSQQYGFTMPWLSL
ncbi:hypothetical protein [Aestuariivirga sp.]|uniref:hypothetical protein n=1 Tax=Aestuariivirga sp. TaxID=2650926 RepID=UPI003593BA51